MLASLRSGPVLIAIGLVALFAVGGAVFTAANTVPASSAGEGTSTVSGYTISAIAYNLNGTDPSNVDTITFTATADNGSTATTLPNLFAEFDDSSNVYYTCTRLGGTAPAHNISCDTSVGTQLTVANADVFHVIITE
jgi:hypothetical protein